MRDTFKISGILEKNFHLKEAPDDYFLEKLYLFKVRDMTVKIWHCFYIFKEVNICRIILIE